MSNSIPIIDIFAGPGGLGEGFSAFKENKNQHIYKIKLSIEMDKYAHQTLELRAFFRQFIDTNIPPSYYDYLRGQISRDELFAKHPTEAANARMEAWLAELGKTDQATVNSRIKQALRGADTWVLIGGPPCQAYSLVGRSRMIRGNREKFETDPRHQLYKQYLRILADHRPTVFVMENVKGLLSAKLQQQKMFELILNDLRNPSLAVDDKTSKPVSYKLFSISNLPPRLPNDIEPEDFIVRCEDYGIPQARHRIIILGIRSDVYKNDPKIMDKVEQQVSIDDVIGDLPRLRSGLSKETDSPQEWHSAVVSLSKEKWATSVSDDLKDAIANGLIKVGVRLSRGKKYMASTHKPKKHEKWYVDNALKGVCNHETRGHIRQDLHRYYFASTFARVKHRSPTLSDFPTDLLPDHGNVQDALGGSKFNDRFRVQIAGRPSTTVVSHISKDGHYYIHYDSTQCRSLTVREAARLQTFPDNYFFEGNRTQQYHQVGNAVPPLLAVKIAKIVFNLLNNPK